MFVRHAWLPAAVFGAALITACGTQPIASTAAETDAGATAAPSASLEAAPIPIQAGRLTAGTRYLLETEPSLSIALAEPWGAAPTPGGIQLISGQTTVRIVSGFDEVYVGTGTVEAPGPDADAIFDQMQRNRRIAIGESGEAEIAGASAKYLDAEAIYERNVEGGAFIFSVAGAPVTLADRFVNRIFIIDEAPSPLVIIVSGPEAAGREQALEIADAVLASMRIEGE